MYSPMQGVVTPMAENDGYSSEEDPSSLELTPTPEDVPDQASEFDHGPDITSSRVDAPMEADSTIDPVENNIVIHARAYQTEMFEKSLKQNIIVAMDTGSGKTQVAVLRIQAELEKYSDKIIWFLAPTVALCQQQFRVLKSQIGAAQIKLLSGSDGVDTWSDTRIWDDYLKNVRVVVSTYQILLDAITHAFVQFNQLCLIVFDEAHNCVRKHPGSKIMERYRIHKSSGMPCPAILGLTASPIMRSSLQGIEIIEQTLDAVCKTPTIHREELLSTVKRPALSSVTIPESGVRPYTKSMISLAKACISINIHQDPYILRLRSEGTEKSIFKLKKALEKRDTYTIKQMQSLYHKSMEIHQELGPWAADYFIYKAITQFFESIDRNVTWFDTWETAEKEYIANILRQVEIKVPQPFEDATELDLSNKFITLVRELQSAPEDTRCIIFVVETVTVAVLAHMLSSTPLVSNRFRVGTMIGTSNHAARKQDIGDINQVKDNLDLEDFRTGKRNLLIATSVAEEGIDIPACNLVICLNPPPNVKSFIQRRGRARMENSRIVLLLEGLPNQHDVWIELERMMKECIEDDTRVARELAELEELDNYPGISPLRVSSTGAQLDFDQAKSHLEHFCLKMTSRQYIDRRPYYISEQINSSSNDPPRISAVVQLPPSLPQAIRRVKGLRQWYSEKNAFKDAAFQAFKAIYEAGLVNDNLMPLIDDILEGIETRSSTIEVNDLWRPWQKIARLWGQCDERVQRELLLKDGDRVIARFQASIPGHFPKLPPFQIYWDADNTWTVETGEHASLVTACTLKEDQSAALIDLAYGHRWPVEDSAHILHLQSNEDIALRQHVGKREVNKDTLDPEFVVRNLTGRPHLFIELLPSKPSLELVSCIEKDAREEPEDIPWLALGNWPRRQDLLHPILNPPKIGRQYPRALPASHCTLDTIDRSKAYFGSIIPSVIHMLEIYLTAEELCRTVLEGVGFSNISLVITAISSRAAGEATDYERLEFLGDSILKTLATVSVMIQRPNYPEGYLSAMKDRIVSNSRLCRASVEKGLDRFILTKSFTGHKWRPLYIKDLVSCEDKPSAKREMSTKTLADVVESLIGAAFIDGGMPKALACLRVFLPDIEWYDLISAHTILSSGRNTITQLRPDHEPLEELVGYKFQNKALLMEALTHASWGLSTSTDVCMERLEFLGDTILDSVIVSTLWAHERELSNNQMHLLRTASVNADLLGFLVMEWCATQETTEISPTDLRTVVTQKPVPFWKYMRQRSAHIVSVQRDVEERHKAERELILDAIAHSPEYPWAKLAHLDIPKFFSDMFESLMGAVWVDSGSMEICKEIVERVGILPYLRRILSDNVDVKHPKNNLGELVGREGKRVKYETEVRMEAGAKDRVCKVFVDDQFIVEVNGGVNPVEVVTKAADEAYHLLLGQNNCGNEITTG
ncbi:RNase3 domain-containing protein [Xylaria cf. heliscus]|nr:RNase3 domain-containing protein [Xylaria cf. heliscus]